MGATLDRQDRLAGREWTAWIVAALAARLAYGIVIHPRLAPVLGWAGDDGYDEIARYLLAGRGFVRWEGGPPALERLPLYPWFLAGLFRIGGIFGEDLVWLVQSVVSALTLVPLAALSRRLGGAAAQRAAALVWAVHPLGAIYTFRFMTEPLHLFWVALFLAAAAGAVDRGGWARGAGCGAALGAALLTRSALLPLVPVLAASLALGRAAACRRAGAARRAALADAARLTAVAAAAGLAVVTPWWVRSQALGGGILSTGSAAAAYHGLAVSRAAWEGTDLGEVDRRSDRELDSRLRAALPDLQPGAGLWEPERERATRGFVLALLLDEPWQRAAEWFRNLSLAWFLAYTPKATAAAAVWQVPLLFLLAAAARRLGRDWPASLWPVLGLIAAQAFLQALLYPHFRFMSPATLAALAVAAAELARLRPGSGRGRARSVA